MTQRIWISLVGVALLVPIGESQTPNGQIKPYVGEIVMSRTGELVSPWKEIRSCDAQKRCITVIANPKTHEVAKYENRWSTRFEATGNGQEVRRAESAFAKSVRLTPDYVNRKSGN